MCMEECTAARRQATYQRKRMDTQIAHLFNNPERLADIQDRLNSQYRARIRARREQYPELHPGVKCCRPHVASDKHAAQIKTPMSGVLRSLDEHSITRE